MMYLVIGSEDKSLYSYMSLVTLKIEGHHNLIISLGPQNDVSVHVWAKSGHWFRIWSADKFSQSYMAW